MQRQKEPNFVVNNLITVTVYKNRSNNIAVRRQLDNEIINKYKESPRS